MYALHGGPTDDPRFDRSGPCQGTNTGSPQSNRQTNRGNCLTIFQMKATPLPANIRIFSDVTKVSRTNIIQLKADGVLNPDDTVISWARLSPKLVAREITEVQAKQLILLELSKDKAVREDIVTRLVNYLSYSVRESTLAKIAEFRKPAKKAKKK